MFSLIDLADAKQNIYAERDDVYTPAKNEMAFELSQMTTTDRGNALEYMVAKRMKLAGIDAEHIGGTNDFDIKLFVNGRIVRCEVKSSLLGPKSNKYCFQKIKPTEFDILFLAFVHPTDGVVVKSCGIRTIQQWIAEYEPTPNENGYNVYFNATMINEKMRVVTWNPTGEGVVA